MSEDRPIITQTIIYPSQAQAQRDLPHKLLIAAGLAVLPKYRGRGADVARMVQGRGFTFPTRHNEGAPLSCPARFI
jgi:hypothetical protein